MADVFDDILGSDNSPARGRGRPKGSFKKVPPPNMKYKPIGDNKLLQLDDIYTGVSVDWLSKVFRMSRAAVVASLADCPPLRDGGAKHYDLATAAAYLVDPVKDLQAAMKKLKAEDLPENLRESFWNAQIKELKYQTLAGELWPTKSVEKVQGDAFKAIRSHTMLWADTVEEKAGMNPKQHSVLTGLVDQLLNELHATLVAFEKKSATHSKIADLYDPSDDAI
ncbi:DUF1441 family protein [Rhizobium sp.]|uniref:DUF1441 family protein n=1 Tax=Rhizobium sp. TaxID=391 RepID=UPI0028AD04B4